MSKQGGVTWPPLDVAYKDEFGDIDPEVYQTAGVIWPDAERLAARTLHDPATGLNLLIKAVAAVTRVKGRSDSQIDHLEAYLFQTYKRLVLAQLEKENARRIRETKAGADLPENPYNIIINLEQKELAQEVISRMDEWTLNVLRLLMIDCTYEEIGRTLDVNPHTARIKFRRQCRKIVGRLREDLKSAD